MKVRRATAAVERRLADTAAFPYTAIFHEDRVTGMRGGRREFGEQIEMRCRESVGARNATPTPLAFEMLQLPAREIIDEVPGVVSVTGDITSQPPSTLEAV